MKFSLSKKKDFFGLSDSLIFNNCPICGKSVCSCDDCYDDD